MLLQLQHLSEGLLYISESEYPFSVTSFGLTDFNAVKAKFNDTRLLDVQAFFDKLTSPQPWWDEFYHEQAPKFAAIYDLFQTHCTELLGFKAGQIEIGIYILGKTAQGDIIAWHTTAIET